jgi:2,4'-dihydroxyacetophenone dioxygenase
MTTLTSDRPLYAMPGIAHEFMTPELISHAPKDPRAWVPRPGGGEFLPCMFDTVTGAMANLFRYTAPGTIGRHLHASPVYAYTIEGQWRYREHNWVAKPGTFVFEAPGEVHTLIVDKAPMLGFFVWMGGYQLCDENDNIIGASNVHTLITACDKHYREVGLGPDYIRQFVRG